MSLTRSHVRRIVDRRRRTRRQEALRPTKPLPVKPIGLEGFCRAKDVAKSSVVTTLADTVMSWSFCGCTDMLRCCCLYNLTESSCLQLEDGWISQTLFQYQLDQEASGMTTPEDLWEDQMAPEAWFEGRQAPLPKLRDCDILHSDNACAQVLSSETDSFELHIEQEAVGHHASLSDQGS